MASLSYLFDQCTVAREGGADTYTLVGTMASTRLAIDEETVVVGDGSRRVTARQCTLAIDTADSADIGALRAWIADGPDDTQMTATLSGADVEAVWAHPVFPREVEGVERSSGGPAFARFELFTADRAADVTALSLV